MHSQHTIPPGTLKHILTSTQVSVDELNEHDPVPSDGLPKGPARPGEELRNTKSRQRSRIVTRWTRSMLRERLEFHTKAGG